MFRFHFAFLLLFSLFFAPVFGQNKGIPAPPNPSRLVNNLSKAFPDFISKEQEKFLESKLDTFARKSSNQIVIVIIDDLADYEPWEFATRLGENWGVGHEKEDNGIVLLIKPTQDRKAFIAVGKGLEGIITDVVSSQIIKNDLLPYFKKGDFFKGLDQTTTVLMSLAQQEYDAATYNKKNKKTMSPLQVVFLVLFIIIFFIAFIKRGGGGKGNGMTTGSRGIFFGGMGSGFGGGSSSGGGGFGGFGGGGFGGGGSGGSW
jgi:uncharacterized protein